MQIIYTHRNVTTNFSNDEDKMLTSSMEALNMMKNNMSNKEYNIHKRRLNMRRKILTNPDSKLLEYLKNIDIATCFLFYKMI